MESAGFVALAPFAPRFPFETWILPTRHRSAFEETGVEELRGLAEVLGGFLRRLDRVLRRPPFNFMLHTAPLREGPLEHFPLAPGDHPEAHNVAGYEWGTGFFINPVPPEDAPPPFAKVATDAGGVRGPWYNSALRLRE